MQAIVVNISEEAQLLFQAYEHPEKLRVIGVHLQKRVRPSVIFPTLKDAEEEAARLACKAGKDGNTFAVFELVAIVRGEVLADSDHVKGIGPCSAMVPKWQNESLEIK